MEEIKKILIKVLEQNHNEIKVLEITEQSHLRDDLGLDSFDLALLTVLIEDKFGIDIFEKEIIQTVGEIIKKIENE